MRFIGIYFIIEIVLLVLAGRFLGVWNTLFIIFATSIFGVLILRLAGLSTLNNIRQKLVLREAPNSVMMNGLLLGVGGGLLFLPGLLGNIIGLFLVIPVTRRFFTQHAKKILLKYSRRMQPAYSGAEQQNKTDVIEGEWERKDK